jgi:hypothetical protein
MVYFNVSIFYSRKVQGNRICRRKHSRRTFPTVSADMFAVCDGIRWIKLYQKLNLVREEGTGAEEREAIDG